MSLARSCHDASKEFQVEAVMWTVFRLHSEAFEREYARVNRLIQEGEKK